MTSTITIKQYQNFLDMFDWNGLYSEDDHVGYKAAVRQNELLEMAARGGPEFQQAYDASAKRAFSTVAQ